MFAQPYKPEIILIVASGLDDPTMYKPTLEVWTSQAQSWDTLDPSLRHFDTQFTDEELLEIYGRQAVMPSELEPWYEKAEWDFGVSGLAGSNPFEGSRRKAYPNPTRMVPYKVLSCMAGVGYVRFVGYRWGTKLMNH